MIRPRLSVSARIALLAVALSLAANLVLVGIIHQQTRGDALDTLRAEVAEQADALAAVDRGGGPTALDRAVARTVADTDDDDAVIATYDAAGRRRAGAGPAVMAPSSLRQTGFRVARLAGGPPWSERDAGFAVGRVGGGWMVTGRLLDAREAGEQALERALILAAALSLLLGLGVGLVLARYVGRRIDRIADVADGVAAGDLGRRVPMAATRADAFDRLGARVNFMLDRVEALMSELRIVTDSLAHDLRSPLARLRARAEAALAAPDDATRDAALGGLLGEADAVLQMLATLLDISRAQAMSAADLPMVDPAALMLSLAELYGPVAEDAGMALTVAVDDAIPPGPLHRDLLSQAIANLIENAIAHARQGGTIMLRVTEAADALVLAVEDRGPGIAPADRAEALRRFGRLDSARSRPGAGLGLALVAGIARFHGGVLSLEDNEPGLAARIVLPRRPVA